MPSLPAYVENVTCVVTPGSHGNDPRASSGMSVGPTAFVSPSGSASCKLTTCSNERAERKSESIKSTQLRKDIESKGG